MDSPRVNDQFQLTKRNVGAGFAVFLIVFGALVFWALEAPKVYQARTLILFTLGREYVYVPETDQSGVKAPNPGDFQGVVNAEMLLLDDPVLRREAISEVGLARAYPEIAAAEIDVASGDPADGSEAAERARLSQAADALRAATSVSLITGSYVVNVTVSHGDPDIAAALANALTDAYFEKRRRIYSEREITTLRDRLAAAEAQAEDLVLGVRALLDGEDPVVYESVFESAVRTRAQFKVDLASARVDLAVLEESQRAVETQLASLDPLIVEHRDFQPDPIRQNRVEQLATLEGEYDTAVVRLGASHPQAEALRGQIERVRATLTEEGDEITVQRRVGPNPIWNAIESQRIEIAVAIEEARRRITYLQEAADATAEEIAQFSLVMPQLRLLVQGQEDQASRIVSLQSRLRESVAIAQTDERDNVRVIQEAVPPSNPSSMPLRIRLVIAAAVAALAAGAVLLIFALLAPRPAQRRESGPGRQGRAVPSGFRPASGG